MDYDWLKALAMPLGVVFYGIYFYLRDRPRRRPGSDTAESQQPRQLR